MQLGVGEWGNTFGENSRITRRFPELFGPEYKRGGARLRSAASDRARSRSLRFYRDVPLVVVDAFGLMIDPRSANTS